MLDYDLKPDALMTPLLWAYNANVNSSVQLCIGDIPQLILRERVANTIKIDHLKQVFEETLSEWGDKGNFGYNPQLKYKQVFLELRTRYMSEVLRQLTSISPTVVAVVEHDLLPSIEEDWKKIAPKIQGYE